MNYYDVLGVNYTASAMDIKRAYRKLAVIYHPDKNADPQAESIFKVINEAYDVLSDPQKKQAYDLKLQNPFANVVQQPAAPKHRDPAYRPTRPPVYRKSERVRTRELMAAYLPLARKASFMCLAISICLLLDFSLPAHISDETIETISYVSKNYRNSTRRIVHTSNGLDIAVPETSEVVLQAGDKLELRSSAVFRIPFTVEIDSIRIRIGRTIYANFSFAPVMLLIISGFGVLSRNDPEYGFNFGVSSILILLLLIFILLT